MRFPSGVQIAGQIASRIKAHWEGVSVKEDKMRLQEEQKKRVMARKLARDVTAAWSKALAVSHHGLESFYARLTSFGSIYDTRLSLLTKRKKGDAAMNISTIS